MFWAFPFSFACPFFRIFCLPGNAKTALPTEWAEPFWMGEKKENPRRSRRRERLYGGVCVCKDRAITKGYNPLLPFPAERNITPRPYFHAAHLKQKIERSVPVTLKKTATVTRGNKYPSAMKGARVFFWAEYTKMDSSLRSE
jgi:hypothetical protein